jgi:hypothetical protein
MSIRKIDDVKLKNIADSIRNTGNFTDTMYVEDMPATIERLPAYNMYLPICTSVPDYFQYGNKDVRILRAPELSYSGLASFGDCANLIEIDMPKLTTVNDRTFVYCRKLKEINLPNATVIRASGFDSCSSLEKATFNNLGWIKSYAFAYCGKLKKLILNVSSVTTLDSIDAFTSTPLLGGTGRIYVPDELYDSFRRATNWVALQKNLLPMSML